MSYDPFDEARDAMYEQIASELYPDHKAQAIGEFTSERLQSYYTTNPTVMQPAVEAIQEGRRLQEHGHPAAALVFFVTAIELLLKATLLRPVVHGLVHSEGLAEVIVQHTLGQAGFDRYSKLLAKLFSEIVSLDIKAIRRPEATKPLLEECTDQQALRNLIIHQGQSAGAEQAEQALRVAAAVYASVVHHMLQELGLHVIENGVIARSAA
jgi:hypothetical protein